MNAQHIHQSCHDAMYQCPQFRGFDDQSFINYGNFDDIPKLGIPKTIHALEMFKSEAPVAKEKEKPKARQELAAVAPAPRPVASEKEKILADFIDDNWKNDPWISSYSNSPKTKNMMEIALRSIGRYKDRDYCYRVIKGTLLKSDFIDTRPGGNLARDAKYELADRGMKNLLTDAKYSSKIKGPDDAPCGSVLVYDLPGQPGHVEIKTCKGTSVKYASFYASSNDIQNSTKGRTMERKGNPYKLTGVMILPPEKL